MKRFMMNVALVVATTMALQASENNGAIKNIVSEKTAKASILAQGKQWNLEVESESPNPLKVELYNFEDAQKIVKLRKAGDDYTGQEKALLTGYVSKGRDQRLRVRGLQTTNGEPYKENGKKYVLITTDLNQERKDTSSLGHLYYLIEFNNPQETAYLKYDLDNLQLKLNPKSSATTGSGLSLEHNTARVRKTCHKRLAEIQE